MKDTTGTRNIITRNVSFDFVRCGRSEVLSSVNNDGVGMDETGIWGAEGGLGRGVALRDCRRATTVDREGRDCAGLCARGVGVRDVSEEDIACGRDVLIGTTVCVEVVDVDAMEGHGDGVRPVSGLGVGVRLEEGERLIFRLRSRACRCCA